MGYTHIFPCLFPSYSTKMESEGIFFLSHQESTRTKIAEKRQMQPTFGSGDRWVGGNWFSKYKKAESYVGNGESQTGIGVDNADYLWIEVKVKLKWEAHVRVCYIPSATSYHT